VLGPLLQPPADQRVGLRICAALKSVGEQQSRACKASLGCGREGWQKLG